MKLRILTAAMAALAMLGAGGIACATTTLHTFDIVATGWTQFSSSPTPPPIDPVHLNFTLDIDVNAATTTGLTMNQSDLPGPFTFEYVPGLLTLGTQVISVGCTFPGVSFCLALFDPLKSPPTGFFFLQKTGVASDWLASNVTVNGMTPTATPEPESWVLILLGVGVLGVALRARRRPAFA